MSAPDYFEENARLFFAHLDARRAAVRALAVVKIADDRLDERRRRLEAAIDELIAAHEEVEGALDDCEEAAKLAAPLVDEMHATRATWLALTPTSEAA